MRLQASCAALAAAIATLATAGAASAQEWDVAFNAAATSDYVFRGASQSNENFALSGGVDATYGGYRAEAGGFALDFGVIGYFYTDAPSAGDYDYVEYKAAASRAIGPLTAGVAVYYSPDFFGVDETATYLEANAAVTPIDKVTISGALGKQWLDVTGDYVTWNVGASYALTDNLAFDVRYHDTDVDNAPLYDGRVNATLKLAF